MMVAALRGHPLVSTHRVLPGEPAVVRVGGGGGELSRGRPHQQHQEPDQRHPRGEGDGSLQHQKLKQRLEDNGFIQFCICIFKELTEFK